MFCFKNQDTRTYQLRTLAILTNVYIFCNYILFEIIYIYFRLLTHDIENLFHHLKRMNYLKLKNYNPLYVYYTFLKIRLWKYHS